MSRLFLVMADQLTFHDNAKLASLRDAVPGQDVIVMGELRHEATFVKHHKKKITFLFSAMRHFAQEMRDHGFEVIYRSYDETHAPDSFESLVTDAVEQTGFADIHMTMASEHRVTSWQRDFQSRFNGADGGSVTLYDDDRFMASFDDFATWAKGKKQLRMEFFYREMRRRYDCLMQDNAPVGGQWNYDAENRKPPKSGLIVPDRSRFDADAITQDVLRLVEAYFPDHFGVLDGFDMAVTRAQAIEVFERFLTGRLPNFGHYQDAMVSDEPFMYHAHIGFYLNAGLLSPAEVIRAAEQVYHSQHAPLNAVEGFIRQILGWREYIRGIYWHFMPDYAAMNALAANRPLPSFFWHGKTEMNCLAKSIGQTIDYAYAHHIQRLMVIGNFSLLAGLSPPDVNEWFLVVYADAFEWVEMPNVSGMVLFADDGIVASKPYAAGGAYIDRMSDYCKSCRYKVKEKNGKDACPFNYLYWDFLLRHEDKLRSNPRLGMIYRTADKMSGEKKQMIRDDARDFLNALT